MTSALTIVCDGNCSLERQSVTSALPGESIVGSRLEQVLPTALEAVSDHEFDLVVIVTAEAIRRGPVEHQLTAAGADTVTWIDARLGAGLPKAERGRLVAGAVHARLVLARADTTGVGGQTGSDVPEPGEIVVVDAPALAADLATHVPITLLTSTPVGRQRPNVRVREGRALEILGAELTLLFETEEGADRLYPDQLVWPGYEGDVDSEAVHDDSNGVVDAVLRVARERGHEPVTVDPSTCVVGRKGTAGCRACATVCPYDAVSIDVSGDGQVAIDERSCTDCGVCLGVCPTESIASPRAAPLESLADATTAGLEIVGGSDDGLSLPIVGRHSTDEPPVVAFTQHDLEPTVVNASDDIPTIPIPVTDVRRIPASLVLYALAAGAGGVSLIGDPERSTGALERVVDEVKATLSALALEPAVSWVASTNPAAVNEAFEQAHIGRVLTQTPVSHSLNDSEPLPGAPAQNGGHPISAATLSVRALDSLANGPTDGVPAPAVGTVTVEATDCTLCRGCDSMCPTGALEQPDDETLLFDPTVCVGCGLCTACPEGAIDVEETVSVPVNTREPVVEHEPVTCTQCGEPFGTKAGLAQIHRTLDGVDNLENLGLECCPNCRRRGVGGRETEP